jgi:hypothetical protein
MTTPMRVLALDAVFGMLGMLGINEALKKIVSTEFQLNP